MFTVVRSTGEAPGFAPAASSWLRRRHSPRPVGSTLQTNTTVPRRSRLHGLQPDQRFRTAHRPGSAGFEPVDDEEALQHRFLPYAFPSCSPDPAHPAVLGRPDFVAAAPALPGVPRVRLPPASPHRYDGRATKVSHPHPKHQRLMAHGDLIDPDPT